MLWSLDSVTLPGRRLPRLDGVTLQIHEGVTGVLGQSGAGKTSLLNLLVGFERLSSGKLVFRAASPPDSLAIFWAPPNQGLWPHLTVREHLTTVSPEVAGREDVDADKLLARFDLLELAMVKPDSLSLGERSRLNVARALYSRATVLVMDEPLSHVDSARCGKYWEVIREECSRHGMSVVFSTHSPEVVLQEAGQVICLADGRIAYVGDVNELYDRPTSQDLATMLGPCNWLTADETNHWFPRDLNGALPHETRAILNGVCVRPERIVLEPLVDSPFHVEDARFTGTSSEIHLRDERSGTSRRFIYRPHGAIRVKRGDRVLLKLLLLLVVVGLSGCLTGESPTLPVKHESNWMMPPDGARVPAPRSITVSPANEYLVLDNAGRVLVYDEHGKLQRQWWMPEYSVGKAEGICVLKDGRIAVADTHYHRVVFFDHDGEVSGMFGQIGSEPGDFVYPVAIAQDPDENIYVCEYGRNDRVQKFRPNGKFVLQFGGPGTERGQFQRPSGIAWFDHKLYVVDAFNNRVQVFTEEGKLVEILGESDKISEVHYPYDITVNQNGDLFVVEYGAGRVSKFSRQGRLLGRYGTSGPGRTTAQFSTPWSLTIDRRGRLYVCDTGNRRIVELEL